MRPGTDFAAFTASAIRRHVGTATQCLLSQTADASWSGGMAARYRSGYLVPGGVERSLTQKPWRPGTPSPGIIPHPKLAQRRLASMKSSIESGISPNST
jgi:hypothetical protein